MRIFEFDEEQSEDFERMLENELRTQGEDMEYEDSLKIENYSPLIQLFFTQEDI